MTLEDSSINKESRVVSSASVEESFIPPATPKVENVEFEAFKFKGDAKEYFKIWIVNIALSIITLGVYSAWAKVRTNRYIYGNTYINNSNFEFNAQAKRILIGRAIIVLFYGSFVLFSDYLSMYKVALGILALFLLILPWLIRQAISFRLKSASYRNIPFKFSGKIRSFYLISVIGVVAIVAIPFIISEVYDTKYDYDLALLLGIVLYILLFAVIMPILYRRYKATVINNSSYANVNFSFSATNKDSIKMFIKMGFLNFVLILLFGIIFTVVTKIVTIILNFIDFDFINSVILEYIGIYFATAFYLFFTGLYKGIVDGYLSNFTRNFTQLEDIKFKGKIDPAALGVISATNMLMLVFSFGLLYPHTKLRYLKYKIENTYIACDNYDKFTSQGYENSNAIGEEALDFFDIDIGV